MADRFLVLLASVNSLAIQSNCPFGSFGWDSRDCGIAWENVVSVISVAFPATWRGLYKTTYTSVEIKLQNRKGHLDAASTYQCLAQESWDYSRLGPLLVLKAKRVLWKVNGMWNYLSWIWYLHYRILPFGKSSAVPLSRKETKFQNPVTKES